MGASGCDNGAHGAGPAPPSGLRDASAEPGRTGFSCPTCGRFVVTAIDGWFRDPKHGSPRRFCDHACRQAAYRRRRAGVPETTPVQLLGGWRRRLNPDQGQQHAQSPNPKPNKAPQGEAV